MSDQTALDAIRKKIWNQNLISIVMTLGDMRAIATSVSKRDLKPETIELADARQFGPYSRADLRSGAVFTRHTDWFLPEAWAVRRKNGRKVDPLWMQFNTTCQITVQVQLKSKLFVALIVPCLT